MRGLQTVLMIVMTACAIPAAAHQMGQTIPLGYASDEDSELAAHVVAAYFEEQMGREMKLVACSSLDECLRSVEEKNMPMAIISLENDFVVPKGLVRVGPPLVTGGQVLILVMGASARQELQFSLVPAYMEKLSSGIDPTAWQEGVARAAAGAGIRKAALDLLRERDLL